jgi:hypothetical protein
MKIKDSMIGAITHSPTLGYAVKVETQYIDLFVKEKRFDLLDDFDTNGDLIPLLDKTVLELRELAKDMTGYRKTMRKSSLIKLIQNVTP